MLAILSTSVVIYQFKKKEEKQDKIIYIDIHNLNSVEGIYFHIRIIFLKLSENNLVYFILFIFLFGINDKFFNYNLTFFQYNILNLKNRFYNEKI